MILRSDYYPFGTRTGTYAEAADMPAVVVTIEELRAFANKWREAIGYNTKSNLKKEYAQHLVQIKNISRRQPKKSIRIIRNSWKPSTIILNRRGWI